MKGSSVLSMIAMTSEIEVATGGSRSVTVVQSKQPSNRNVDAWY